jgi:hypothetical protein
MKQSVLLTITSLLTMLLLTFHLADDIVRGFEGGGPTTYTGIVILVVWLYATLMLMKGRAGYIIILLGSLLGSAVPYFHMRGASMAGGRIANSVGMFFFVWTLLATGVVAMFSVLLAARGLWTRQWEREQRQHQVQE